MTRTWIWAWVWGLAVSPSFGACEFVSSQPGIQVPVCQVPACPSGGDCTPPTVSAQSVSVRFDEPLYRWLDTCPAEFGNASCWEVLFQGHAAISASDASGIQAVGLNVSIQAGPHQSFQKVWAEGSSGSGQLRLRTHVPPGQTVRLSIYELCARDMRGNETCVFPLD